MVACNAWDAKIVGEIVCDISYLWGVEVVSASARLAYLGANTVLQHGIADSTSSTYLSTIHESSTLSFHKPVNWLVSHRKLRVSWDSMLYLQIICLCHDLTMQEGSRAYRLKMNQAVICPLYGMSLMWNSCFISSSFCLLFGWLSGSKTMFPLVTIPIRWKSSWS